MQQFFELVPRRVVNQPGWPADLSDFFASFEGCGLEREPTVGIRLCRLDEVLAVAYKDISVLSDAAPNWGTFTSYRIGISPFFDDIVYVTSSPVCAPGSIMLLGPDVAGPGGEGLARHEATLVLARSLAQWIEQLKRWNGVEYGVCPGEVRKLPELQRNELQRYYRELNPHIEWGY
jgi:hypothetical protein